MADPKRPPNSRLVPGLALTENRDPVKTYNRKTSDAVAGSLGSFDWSAFTDAAGFGELESFVVRQPSYLEACRGSHG